jgi:hypothetical protein
MSTYVRIYADTVVEQIETDGDVSTMYPSTLVWVCVDDVDPLPRQGWTATQQNGEWQFLPEPPITIAPETRAVAIAAERFVREAAGVSVDGLTIETTRDSQSLISGMAISAILDPEYKCSYKAVAGFIELTSAQILGVATAVRSHVQACFDREKFLLEAVETGTYTDDMLTEGWPDSSSATPLSAHQ